MQREVEDVLPKLMETEADAFDAKVQTKSGTKSGGISFKGFKSSWPIPKKEEDGTWGWQDTEAEKRKTAIESWVGKFRETKDTKELYKGIKDTMLREQQHILRELKDSVEKFDVLAYDDKSEYELVS